MAIFHQFDTVDTPSRVSYYSLAVILGGVTLLTFGTERLLYETTGTSLGDIPAYIMGGMVVAVGVSAFAAAVQDHNLTIAVVLALGPVSGFAVYLIGYHLVLPPSSDSPTWLIFLAFAAGFAVLGVGSYLFGRLVTQTG